MEKHLVEYNGNTIEFELRRKPVKNINLTVRPDLSVMVSANKLVSLDHVKRFVREKSPFILKHQSRFQQMQDEMPRPKEYINGETFKYLGRKLRLHVEEETTESVTYDLNHLYMRVKDPNNCRRKKKLVDDWYRKRAENVFSTSLDEIYPRVEKYRIQKPGLVIRSMKTRWGSCAIHKGHIILNLHLIKAPPECIDHVVLHELIHFKYIYHNQDFYDLMTTLMPDWKRWKELLDGGVTMYL